MTNINFDEEKSHYITITGVIIKDGKYLIAKRAEYEKAYPNKWTVPGGKLEKKDYINRKKDTNSQWYNIFENLLKREVMEETALKIKNIRYLTSICYIRSDGIPTIIVSLFADYESGEVKLCSALTEFAWVDLNDAKKYDLIDGIYEELEMIEECLKGNNLKEWGVK